MREDLATLPTISGRITDITRLTPQYGGNGTFAGQDNRANNMTVDGVVLQQLVRPRRHHRRHRRPHRRRADLARSDRAGAGQRRAVRRAPGQLHRRRRQHRHPQRHQPASPRRSTTAPATRLSIGERERVPGSSVNAAAALQPELHDKTGVWAGGPIVKNKLFAFGTYEKQEDTRPLTTFTSNPGGAPVGGNTTRVHRVGSRRAQRVPVARISTTTPARSTTSRRRRPPSRGCSRATTTSTAPTRSRSATTSSTRAVRHRPERIVARSARRPADRTRRTSSSFAELELRDSREPQVGRRRVELGVRQR